MPKQLVLITGATGHLGFRTLVFILQSGYRARVAVRSETQIDKLKNKVPLKPWDASLEFIVVPDITATGAYKGAIKGVDFVVHVASPIYSGMLDEKPDWKRLLYDPAEKGTLSMLTAAANEPTVKRVVVTSSVAILEPKEESDRAGPYDLKDLPDEETRNTLPAAPMAYTVSKLLAHLRATDYVEQNKPQYDLVRILPGYIQGANDLYTSAASMHDEAVTGSNEGTMRTALGQSAGHPRITAQVFLDDVARAHVFALHPEIVGNLENLLVAGNDGIGEPWEAYAEEVKKQFTDAVAKSVLHPAQHDEDMLSSFDVSESEAKLGFRFAGKEQIVKSVVSQYLGLLNRA